MAAPPPASRQQQQQQQQYTRIHVIQSTVWDFRMHEHLSGAKAPLGIVPPQFLASCVEIPRAPRDLKLADCSDAEESLFSYCTSPREALVF